MRRTLCTTLFYCFTQENVLTFDAKHSFWFLFALFSTAGSLCLFSALLTKCSEKNVFALCRCVARRNYPPRFAALVPQKEVLDDGKVQISAPGAAHPSEAFLKWKKTKAVVRLNHRLPFLPQVSMPSTCRTLMTYGHWNLSGFHQLHKSRWTR